MVGLTREALLEYLQENGYKADFQKETGQIALILNIERMQFPMFIRVLPDGPVLQLVTFFPCNLKKETLSDAARLLHLLNKEIDVPGFGMDETAHVVFYRVTIPALNKIVDPLLLRTHLSSVEAICKSYTPVIFNVLQGTISFEAVLQKAKDEHSKTTK